MFGVPQSWCRSRWAPFLHQHTDHGKINASESRIISPCILLNTVSPSHRFTLWTFSPKAHTSTWFIIPIQTSVFKIFWTEAVLWNYLCHQKQQWKKGKWQFPHSCLKDIFPLIFNITCTELFPLLVFHFRAVSPKLFSCTPLLVLKNNHGSSHPCSHEQNMWIYSSSICKVHCMIWP
jgi:hypothetical protein